MEEQIASTSTRLETLEKTCKNASETTSSQAQALEKASFDLRRSERIASELAEERNRLAAELARTKQQQADTEMEAARWKDLWEQSRSETGRNEALIASLKQQNEGLKKTIEDMQHDLVQSKEALSARSTESDTAFVHFRQKTEALGEFHTVNDLKKQLRDADSAREEALSRETEVTLSVQALKQEMAQSEARWRRALAVREKEISELQSEASELISALEDEREAWTSGKASILASADDLKARLDKVSKEWETAVAERDALQQAQTALERSVGKVKADLAREESAKKALETKVETLETTVFDLKKTSAQQDRQLKELATAK